MRKGSATHYLLEALVPYTDANLRLSFQPKSFFRELERRTATKDNNLRTAYSRAINSGLITLDSGGIPSLSAKGKRKLAPYTAKYLQGAQLLVAFDIPVSETWRRNRFRATLHEFQFKPVQKSLWVSSVDSYEYVQTAVQELELTQCVKIYEAKELS